MCTTTLGKEQNIHLTLNIYVSIIYTIWNRLENYIDPIFLKSKESMSIIIRAQIVCLV